MWNGNCQLSIADRQSRRTLHLPWRESWQSEFFSLISFVMFHRALLFSFATSSRSLRDDSIVKKNTKRAAQRYLLPSLSTARNLLERRELSLSFYLSFLISFTRQVRNITENRKCTVTSKFSFTLLRLTRIHSFIEGKSEQNGKKLWSNESSTIDLE